MSRVHMAVQEQQDVVVVGAGLVGSLAAVYLARRGYKVHVYERRDGRPPLIASDMRNEPFVRGRSINLALSVRGISALQKIGVSEKVLGDGIPMYARMIHVGTSEPSSQPYGLHGQAIYSIDRRKLNEYLITVAEENQNVKFHFSHDCLHLDMDNDEAVFLNRETKEQVKVKAAFVIGADGAYSAVRKEIMKRTRMNLSQEYISHGYKELTIFPQDGNFAMKQNYLHIWPRKQFMMIALPNQDCSFTCTCFFPFSLFDELSSEGKVLSFFEREFPDAIKLLGRENLVKDFFTNPTGPLVTIKASPYNFKGKALVIGDAAHAMVPFYGQGMNAGFEDVEVLDALFERGLVIEDVFDEFSRTRFPQGRSICELALGNYYEMSSSVISFGYLVKMKIYKLLHLFFPKSIIPLYTMVAFSRIPYDQVVERRNWQDRLVKAIGIGLSLISLSAVAFTGVKIARLLKRN